MKYKLVICPHMFELMWGLSPSKFFFCQLYPMCFTKLHGKCQRGVMAETWQNIWGLVISSKETYIGAIFGPNLLGAKSHFSLN